MKLHRNFASKKDSEPRTKREWTRIFVQFLLCRPLLDGNVSSAPDDGASPHSV